jgi:hypothetical protein
MSRSQQRFAVVLVLVLASCGCKSVASDDPAQGKQPSSGGMAASGGSSDDTNGGKEQTGSSPGGSRSSSSGGAGGSGSEKGDHPAGDNGGTSEPGATQLDAALPAEEQPGEHDPDAGTPMVEPLDAAVLGDAMVGSIGTESCCTVHDSPGCSNADMQVCVCEKISSCCTDKWDQGCVLIVTERRCQEGVRDCVCGDGPNQWGQHVCCDSSWGSTCDTTARSLCDAKRGCF